METTTALAQIDASDLEPIGDLPADRNPALVYLASLASANSRSAMDAALRGIASILSGSRLDAVSFPWQLVRYQHVAALKAKLGETKKPATVNLWLSALRGVMRECWRLGLIDAESLARAIDIKSVKSSPLPSGRALSSGELRQLFAACADGTNAGKRDAALLALCYGAGLRRSEAVSLNVEDYNAETGALTIRAGKGNKDRLVYATNGTKIALDAWLSIRGDDDGALFLPTVKGGSIQHRRMTAQSVMLICAKRANDAGIQNFTPHDLRRSFVSDLLDAGADISTVANLAGHANVQTTARYDRRGEVAKQRAAGMLFVPVVAE